MKEPSSEQLKEIGRAVLGATDLERGRAAWDACLPIILAEPDAAEVLAFRTKHPRMPDPIGANFACFIGFRREYMTAKPDPAENAVLKSLEETGLVQGTFLQKPEIIQAVKKIVAAVDEARKK